MSTDKFHQHETGDTPSTCPKGHPMILSLPPRLRQLIHGQTFLELQSVMALESVLIEISIAYSMYPSKQFAGNLFICSYSGQVFQVSAFPCVISATHRGCGRLPKAKAQFLFIIQRIYFYMSSSVIHYTTWFKHRMKDGPLSRTYSQRPTVGSILYKFSGPFCKFHIKTLFYSTLL